MNVVRGWISRKCQELCIGYDLLNLRLQPFSNFCFWINTPIIEHWIIVSPAIRFFYCTTILPIVKALFYPPRAIKEGKQNLVCVPNLNEIWLVRLASLKIKENNFFFPYYICFKLILVYCNPKINFHRHHRNKKCSQFVGVIHND